jgi:maleylacetoacetate isomerase
MRLYSYWRSTTSYRVRIALNLKGVAYETCPIDLVAGEQRDAAYAALNPVQGVPTLVLDDGTTLVQSMAILEYLDTLYPAPRLIPEDPLQRAKTMAVAHTVAMDIHPVNNLRVIGQLKTRFGATAEDAKIWMQHWMMMGFTAVEALLPDGDAYAFGDVPNVADVCLSAQLYNAHRWGVDLNPFPKIARIENLCSQHPAFSAAHPDNQPDAKDIS